MSDEQINPADGATDTEQTAEQEQTTEAPDFAKEAEKWKALARKHEAQAKANADKAKRLDELEEASKTEAQKQAEALEKLAKENADLKAATLRAEVANAKGVPAALLSGATEEELNASADALLSFRGTPPKAPSADGQGRVGDPLKGATKLTREDLKSMSPDQIVKAREDGLLDDLFAR